MMTAQPSDLNTMDFSTESTTVNTINTPLFIDNAESPLEPNDTILKEFSPTPTEKTKKKEKVRKCLSIYTPPTPTRIKVKS